MNGDGEYAYINRDPFARETLVRDTITKSHLVGTETCAWCGNVRKSGSLFHYGVDPDGGRGIAWDDKLFDSIDCRRTYYS